MARQYPCVYCGYVAGSSAELLDHEDMEHGEMVEALENEDGSEPEEIEETDDEE